MKLKKQKGRGSLVSRVSLCFFSFLLSFLILISPFSAFASSSTSFTADDYSFFITDSFHLSNGFYEWDSSSNVLYAYTPNGANLSAYWNKPLQVLNTSTVYTSPILCSIEATVDNIVLVKGAYIHFSIYFYQDNRYTSISDLRIGLPLTDSSRYVAKVNSFDYSRTTGELSFDIKCPVNYSSTNFSQFYIQAILNFPEQFNNTWIKIESIDIKPVEENTALLGGVIDFLKSILTGIQNLPTAFANAINQIQNWLSSLGSTIGGFFTNIWNSISTTWSTFWTNLSSALTTFKDNVGTWFTNLKDNIHTFFVNLVEDIKSLFVPSETWQRTNRTRWNTWTRQHFGALVQIRELTSTFFNELAPLFDTEQADDISITFPSIKLPSSIFGSDKYLLHSTEFSFADNPFFTNTVLGEHLFDIWSVMVSVVCIFALLVFVKKQYYRVFANQNIGGDDL